MSIKRIVEILNKEGRTIPGEYTDFVENYVSVWTQWYRGHVPGFHNYKTAGGERKTVDAIRSKLHMAKTVAEDWASFLLNEKTYISVDDENTLKFLVGDDVEQEGGILGANSFWLNANKLVERAFATGTGAVVITIDNATVEKDVIVKGDIKLKFIKNPERIIPLKWENNNIVDCAFITSYVKEKKRCFNAQIHEKVADGYKITNKEYRYTETKYEEVPFEGIQSYTVPAKTFVTISPNLENNYVDDIPLGVSIYSSSIDEFKSGDLAYTNFDKDFLLGGKKIFISQDGVAGVMDPDGKFIPSADDTAEQSMYVILPKNLDSNTELFNEFNPLLRVEENTQGIQTSLNLISMKCKLGPNFYNFDSESKRVYQNTTSTKANAETLVRSVSKQRIMVVEFLRNVVSGVLTIANLLGEGVKVDSKLTVTFDDTYFNDEEAERNRALQELREGILNKWEYRCKWYGETEEEARQKISEIEGTAAEEENGGFFN